MAKTTFALFASVMSFVASSGVALAQSGDMKSRITLDLIHTAPECAYEGKASTWCLNENNNDNKAATERAGMVARINSILDQYALQKVDSAKAKGSTPKVYVAYFSFSNKLVHKKLCEVGKAGIPMEIVLDNGSQGQADTVAVCNKDETNPNVKVSYLGGMTSSPWRLHHNKFLVVDPGDGTDWSINFSSGNLSAFGTGLHLDHWVLSTAPGESNLAKSHTCVIDGLRSAIQRAKEVGMYDDGMVKSEYDEEVAYQYITSRESCFKKLGVIPTTQTEKALAAEGISPVYSPNENNEAARVLSSEIRRVTDLARQGKPAFLYVAIQHFLHYPTMQGLRDAAAAGADVRIVMDDDVVSGQSEVAGVGDFYEQNLKNSGIKIRFAQTNADVRQMMHNKLAIFNGQRTFSGAGHYTTAALRNNWENFYLIDNKDLARKYLVYFKELWEKSITESAAQGGKNSAPQSLSPEALKIINGQ